jgi:hypothetical protein
LPLQTLGGAGPIGQFWGSIKGEALMFLDTSTKIGFVLFSTEFLLNFLVVKGPFIWGVWGPLTQVAIWKAFIFGANSKDVKLFLYHENLGSQRSMRPPKQ